MSGRCQQWPPDHSLVDIDPPSHQDVADHEGIAE